MKWLVGSLIRRKKNSVENEPGNDQNRYGHNDVAESSVF